MGCGGPSRQNQPPPPELLRPSTVSARSSSPSTSRSQPDSTPPQPSPSLQQSPSPAPAAPQRSSPAGPRPAEADECSSQSIAIDVITPAVLPSALQNPAPTHPLPNPSGLSARGSGAGPPSSDTSQMLQPSAISPASLLAPSASGSYEQYFPRGRSSRGGRLLSQQTHGFSDLSLPSVSSISLPFSETLKGDSGPVGLSLHSPSVSTSLGDSDASLRPLLRSAAQRSRNTPEGHAQSTAGMPMTTGETASSRFGQPGFAGANPTASSSGVLQPPEEADLQMLGGLRGAPATEEEQQLLNEVGHLLEGLGLLERARRPHAYDQEPLQTHEWALQSSASKRLL